MSYRIGPITLVNLTPHAINILQEGRDQIVIPPSGTVCRINLDSYLGYEIIDKDRKIGFFVNCPIGSVELPSEEVGVIYIVSRVILSYAISQGRKDFCCPGSLVRDSDGNIIGCKGLDLN